MKPFKALLCLSLPALLCVGLCAACSEDSTEEEGPVNVLPFEPAGPTAAPDPMQMGPFPVGVTTLDLFDESRLDPETQAPRLLRLEIWYPAVQAVAQGPFLAYDLTAEATPENVGDLYETVSQADLPLIETRSVRDAEMDREHSPYPLVFFSHGSNGVRWQSIFYTILLASHGYVVISPDHAGNTIWEIIRDGWDAGTVAVSAPQRVADMEFLLDEFERKNELSEDFFYHSFDRRKVGITGHSFGGWTTLSMLCKDDRFKVGVAQAPEIPMAVAYCDFDNIPAPILVMGGTLDSTLRWRDQYCGYQSLGGEHQKVLVEIEGAGHFTFSDICRLDLLSLSEQLDLGGQAEDALNDGCADFNLPFETAQDIINHYSVAFFNFYLRDAPAAMDVVVDMDEPPFDACTLWEGQAPDWPDGGC